MELGANIPKLGFGLMRLPLLENGEIDIEQLKAMVDTFLERGFTYFDTAFSYHDGHSEAAAKTALFDRHPRSSFQFATKLPAWLGPKTAEEAQNMFWTSLERTGAGYFDFYLLHNLGGQRVKAFDDFGIWDFVQARKKEGLIRHIGFSFHDKAAVLDAILTNHPEMEFVQLQINYADWESPGVESRKCYEVARKHNKPVIIMEPIKGGALADPPDTVKKVLDAAACQIQNPSYASWAVRFAATLPGIITVLSGMSTLPQLLDNTSYMQHFVPLNLKEQEAIVLARQELDKIPTIPCTACQYCLKGCPQNIAIPQLLDAYNRKLIYPNDQAARHGYMLATRQNGKPTDCIACGACESVCPQSIPIIESLQIIAKELG